MKDLNGKVVVVTGAAGGIGRATALAFASKGARVCVADIDEQGAAKVAAEIEELGSDALSLRVDVAKESEIESMIDETVSSFGDLDVIVNNAGVSVSGPAETVPIEDWQWIMDINVWSHVYAIRKCLPYFKAKGSGHIVHIASAAGIIGGPGLAAYCTTKFAVFGLAESLAVSLHGSGIGVSVVCPMWVSTDIVMGGRITVDPDLGINADESKMIADQMLKSTGIPPEKVGAQIVEAVENETFLVLPHPEVLKFAQTKWSDPEGYIGRAAAALESQRKTFGEAKR